jgi:hypothetical protein
LQLDNNTWEGIFQTIFGLNFYGFGVQSAQHVPPQSILQASQHFFSQALQQRSVLFTQNLSRVPNQLYTDCVMLFFLTTGLSDANAETAPNTKSAKKTSIAVLFIMTPPLC